MLCRICASDQALLDARADWIYCRSCGSVYDFYGKVHMPPIGILSQFFDNPEDFIKEDPTDP